MTKHGNQHGGGESGAPVHFSPSAAHTDPHLQHLHGGSAAASDPVLRRWRLAGACNGTRTTLNWRDARGNVLMHVDLRAGSQDVVVFNSNLLDDPDRDNHKCVCEPGMGGGLSHCCLGLDLCISRSSASDLPVSMAPGARRNTCHCPTRSTGPSP